ncbi:hypothetical protein PM082_009609 [Marasmius tenuissimus]|nr:hypothetical protein PM082_009609 [Marasmius tenuissimus]
MTSKASSNFSDRYLSEYQYNFGILLPLLVSSVHLFLYGFNVLLFRIGIVVLRKRERDKDTGNRLFRLALFSLFALSTVGVPVGLISDILNTRQAFSVASGLEYTVEASNVHNYMQICRAVILAMMSLVVDSIMVFRSFVICGWPRKRYSVTLISTCYVLDVSAMVLAIWSTEKNWFSHYDPSSFHLLSTRPDVIAFMSSSCVFLHLSINVVMTIVIAHKIFWRNSRENLGTNKLTRSQNIVLFLVESCLLYIVAWIALIAWIISRAPHPMIFESILIQVAGITPILVIVRANTQQRDDKAEYHRTNHTRAPLTVKVTASVEEDVVLKFIGSYDMPKTA